MLTPKTMQEAVNHAFGCCINMTESLSYQYFWLAARFLEDEKMRPNPRELLAMIDDRVDRMITASPYLKK